MITYIKNDIPSSILAFDEELNPQFYTIGTTYDDYLNGKWVKLSDEQVAYYQKNPNASIKNIWEMTEVSENIETVRNKKIAEIDYYDKSSNVNSFNLNGYSVWVDRDTRVSLMNTTQIKKESGEPNTTIWFDNYSFTLPCETAIQMLSQLEMYAYDCFNQTAKHKATVSELDDIEAIKSYDYTTGYPEKLSFDTLS